MVGTFDLHGIVTEKMMASLNGLAVQHTYPHIDMGQVGTLKMLLQPCLICCISSLRLRPHCQRPKLLPGLAIATACALCRCAFSYVVVSSVVTISPHCCKRGRIHRCPRPQQLLHHLTYRFSHA